MREGKLRKNDALLNDMVNLGAGHFVVDPSRSAFRTRMRDEFGQLPDELLDAVYDRSKAKFAKFMHRSALKDVPEVRDFLSQLSARGFSVGANEWFTKTAPILRDIGFPEDAIEAYVKFLSVTSPNQTVKGNTTVGLKVLAEFLDKEGGDVTRVGAFPAVKEMVKAVADTAGSHLEVGGLKVRDFVAAGLGDKNAVVVDRHVWKGMLKMPGTNPAGVADYRVAQSIVRNLAKEAGQDPSDYFAAAWAGIQLERGAEFRGFGDLTKQRLVVQDATSERILGFLQEHTGEAKDAIRKRLLGSFTPQESLEAAFDVMSAARRKDNPFTPPGSPARQSEVARGQDILRGAVESGADVAGLSNARQDEITKAFRQSSRKNQVGAIRGDLAIVFVEKMLRGARTAKELTTQAVAEFGEGIRAHVLPARERAFRWINGLRFALTRGRTKPGEGPRPTRVDPETPKPIDRELPKQDVGPVNDGRPVFGTQEGPAPPPSKPSTTRIPRMVDRVDEQFSHLGAVERRGIRDFLARNEEELNAFARDTQPIARTQAIADTLIPDASKRLARGTALNAEQMKSMMDAVGMAQAKAQRATATTSSRSGRSRHTPSSRT
jgi:hypothetical protein